MANILITGITGLIGSHLSEELSNLGHTLYGVTRRIYNKANYEPVLVDLSSDWKISELPTNIDVIYHLAQSDKFRDFPAGAPDVFQVNINSTAKLLDYAKKISVRSFIYSSSGGVYGNGDKPFLFFLPIVPFGELGYYLGSKACGEILVQSYAQIFQVNIVRPFFLYGRAQKRDMLIPRLFDNVVNDKPVYLSGKNGIRLNPLYVNDGVEALTAILDRSDSNTYNLGGPEILSIRQICNIFGSYLGTTPNYKLSNDLPKDLVGDISLTTEVLYKPKIKLSEVVPEIDGKI
ncbi:MAG: NAD(P)-dependent oxidoreductase [Opitutales bacterium]|nr:NAD(P)-dependent oxidoreductase [Opitutales bacterium]